MIDNNTRLLQEVILDTTQAAVEVSVDATAKRRGLRAHFRGWTRQDGPVFRLTPSGLTRHVVDLRFGSYARPCIEHIEQNATEEQYAVARALVAQVGKEFELSIYPHNEPEAWKVSSDLRIEVTIKGLASQQDEDAVKHSTQHAMVPLIAAVAELIGCDDDESEERGDEEGACFEVTMKRRERSRRNRLLCLAIHGSICTVCGVDPASIYGPKCGQILEVHHLEPLSEAAQPRLYDPKTDLIPLCPNCHRAIHRRIPAYYPDELRALMPNK